MRFLSDEMEEPFLRQYHESSAKNTTYESSDSCDSFLVSLNSYLKNTTCQRIFAANGVVLFADEATSAARKEMMSILYWLFFRSFEIFHVRFHVTGICIIHKIGSFNKKS